MLKIKFRIIAWSAMVLWLVVLMQTVVTRLYVSQTAFQQAFARNQIAVVEDADAEKDSRNEKNGNVIHEGFIRGRLSSDRQQEVAQDIFREFGGEEVMSSKGQGENNYYVAYGYTRGLTSVKKVNGKQINLTVTMSYDEQADGTRVVVGAPLVNSDF